MGMLKKIFNWKSNELSAAESSVKDVGRRATQNTPHPPHQNQHPINLQRHDQHGSDRNPRRAYHSETDIDPRLSSNTTAHKSLSGVNVLKGYTQVQEVASTVVCDFGEMDAASPAVQQVTITIAKFQFVGIGCGFSR
jgi:hypothetical protein